MSASTPIAKMVREMISRGVDIDVIELAVATAEAVVSGGQRPTPVDSAAERRRAWDRDRKREQRALRLPDSEWFPLVGRVLERDGHRCTYCGSTEKLTADHLVPVTRGGSNEMSNLTACCLPCNTRKGNKLVRDWPAAASTVFHHTVHPNPQTQETPLTYLEDKEVIKLEIKKERAPTNRGTRMSADWQPSPDDWTDTVTSIGAERTRAELLKFRDYWVALPGAKGLKLDWPATWRNWIRRVSENTGGPNGQRNINAPRRSASSDFFAGIAGVAADIAGNGSAPRDEPEEIPLGRFNING